MIIYLASFFLIIYFLGLFMLQVLTILQTTKLTELQRKIAKLIGPSLVKQSFFNICEICDCQL